MKPENVELPKCACGCGQTVRKPSNTFVFGHHRRLQTDAFPLCACGCGQRVKRPMSRWVRGHSSRRYCACGCGQPAPPNHRYIQHHHLRDTRERPLCACGCGERVSKPNRTFIKGHSTRLRYLYKQDPKTYPYCACGCGKHVAKAGNEWIRGHQMRAFNFAGPTEHEGIVQRTFQKKGRAFLFNLGLYGACRPDFQFPEAMLIVEVDGRDHRLGKKLKTDAEKDAFLSERGWLVLRWSHKDINERLDDLMEQFESIYQSRLSCS